MSKGPDAFRTISEASEDLGVPQHVLRFWETRFTFIKPMKRAGGRRLYRPADLATLRQGNCVIDDLRLTQTDLEDVFLAVMQSSGSAPQEAR